MAEEAGIATISLGNAAERMAHIKPPRALLVDGEPPVVEFPDEVTVRYTWQKPNPHFISSLAGARPLYIYRPAHYLKRFHNLHTDEQTLASRVSDAKARDWLARVFQHEIDHLNGVLYTDRLKDPTKLAFLEEYERYLLPVQADEVGTMED